MEPSNLVTITQIGGLWCAVQVFSEDIQFVSNPFIEKKTAEIAAKTFAAKENLPFIENAFFCNRPIVSIWYEFGGWLPVKIFATKVVGAGLIFQNQSEAIEIAEKIASNEKLACVPSIGASIFEKK